MGLEISFLAGAFLLLTALIYATLQWHYRNRRTVRIGGEVVRKRYEKNEG